jgi:hypothetical protein
MAEPVLVALLFADQVIVEQNTQKKVIVGTFTRFHSDKFPVSFPPWTIFAAVTNLIGEHSFSINLVYDREKQVVVPLSGKLRSPYENAVLEVIFPIRSAIFPGEGTYTLTFNIDGNQIGSRLLEVEQPAKSDKGEIIQK